MIDLIFGGGLLPALLGLLTLLAGLFGFVKYRDHAKAKEIHNEIAVQQASADAAAAIARQASDEAVRRAGADAARDELHKDWDRPGKLRGVETDQR